MIPMHKFNEIMPTPQKARYGNQYWPVAADSAIILGAKAAAPEEQAARELREWLAACGSGPQLPVLREPAVATGLSIIIGTCQSCRRLDELCRCHHWNLNAGYPGREGYVLRFLKDGKRDVILCAGSDATGAYYAVQSLRQLSQRRGNGLVIRQAEVDDWPICRYRGMYANSVQTGELLSHYKFNGWDIVYTQHEYRWRNPTRKYHALVTDLTGAAQSRGMNAVPYVNPVWCERYQYGGDPDKITISSDRDIRALYRTFKIALDQGSRLICLALDDRASEPGGPSTTYLLTDPDDRRKFGNSLGRAHAYLTRRIYELMKADYPKAILMMVPAYYAEYCGRAAQPYADTYLRELGAVPPEVVIQWTGPSVRSPTILPRHFQRYARLIRRPPAFWDNALYGLHDPPYYLFDLYAAGYYKGFAAQTAFGIHNNGAVEGEVNRVGVMQVADYLWNPQAYDAGRSRERALEAVAGRGLAPLLVRFHDVFQELHDWHPCLRLRNANPKACLDHEAWTKVRKRLGELKDLMGEVERRCANKELVNDLRERFYQPLVKNAADYKVRNYVKRQLTEHVPEGIRIPCEAFLGGNPEGSQAGLMGRASPVHRARALFYLGRRPAHDVLLSIKGEDVSAIAEWPGPVRLRISVNNHTVYEGPSEFLAEWRDGAIRAYPVNRRWLKAGRNVLAIENLERAFSRRLKLFWAKLILV